VSLRHKFCMDNPFNVKKANEHGFYFWFAPSRFFRTWWCRCVPFLTLFFVSGSYSKIRVSSPVITLFLKFLSILIRFTRWRHTSFRFSSCSIVRFLGTNFAHNFFMATSSLEMWWTVVWFKFNSLAIIRTVSRRSDRTRAPTIPTLLSVFEVECLPERGSSSMDSRPSENALNHLNTCDLDEACSPYTCFSLLKVSMPVSQIWHEKVLHIVARNWALTFPWHTHKNCFTRNRTKISVLTLESWNSY